MKTEATLFFESIKENFDSMREEKESKESKPVAFWLPMPEKEKYEMIQNMTNRKFGRAVRERIISLIRSIDIDKAG